MQNLIPIHLLVGDRTYRIKIEEKDEEAVRKMAKTLNDQISQFKSKYAGKDMQDYLAMVLLSTVVQSKATDPTPKSDSETIDFERIESLLDKMLQEDQP